MSAAAVAAAPHPRAAAQLIGHEAAEALLAAAARSGRLPHAWLISGPEGVGKATLAYRFARWLLAGEAERPPTPSLFGDKPAAVAQTLALDPHHPVYRSVAQGAHPDLLALEREVDDKTGKLKTAISVEQARGLREFLHKTAAAGGWRIVIVDTAEDMNVNAANAILKLLEEPPPRTVLLLIAHAPRALLPTIRSRCRSLALRPLALTECQRALAAVAPQMNAMALAELAPTCGGAPGWGLTLAASDGLALARELRGLLAGAPDRYDAAGAFALAERTAKDSTDRTLTLFQRLLLDLLSDEARAAAKAPNGGGDGLARRVGLDRLVEAWEKAGALFKTAETLNLDRRQTVLNAVAPLFFAGRGR